jgi:hypothetical protein
VRTLFKGQIDASVILPMLIGLLYAGTGNWTAERWNAALAIMGIGAGAKAGYERGYNTFNPDLHREPYLEPYQPSFELPLEPEDRQADGRLRDERGRYIKADPRDRYIKADPRDR